MVLVEFTNLLKETMGLDAASIGASVIERAVQQRLEACDVQSAATYLEHVRSSETELQELIEAVVVPETWFFRGGEAFAALDKVACEKWLRTHAEGTLRLLSAPCSSGEEPYSMAMTLLDAGLPGSRFHIDAVDISVHALAQARRAVYGRNSFRGKALSFRDRHFEPTADGYRLTEAVRDQVHFRRGNLLDEDFHFGKELYEIIFCRNLLIYFDRPTQDRVILMLKRLLTDKGLLFVGPAEAALMVNHKFVSTKLPLAFAFRKPKAVPDHEPEIATSKRKSTKAPAIPLVAPVAKIQPMLKAPPGREMRVLVPKKKSILDLDWAQRLADEGRLMECAEICESYLREQKAAAKAFYLLGLVRDAAGDLAEAGEHYRKALYLEPNHYDALMNLAYLAEKAGKRQDARALHSRARRLKERGDK